jgi:hypothetical protein
MTIITAGKDPGALAHVPGAGPAGPETYAMFTAKMTF